MRSSRRSSRSRTALAVDRPHQPGSPDHRRRAVDHAREHHPGRTPAGVRRAVSVPAPSGGWAHAPRVGSVMRRPLSITWIAGSRAPQWRNGAAAARNTSGAFFEPTPRAGRIASRDRCGFAAALHRSHCRCTRSSQALKVEATRRWKPRGWKPEKVGVSGRFFPRASHRSTRRSPCGARARQSASTCSHPSRLRGIARGRRPSPAPSSR